LGGVFFGVTLLSPKDNSSIDGGGGGISIFSINNPSSIFF